MRAHRCPPRPGPAAPRSEGLLAVALVFVVWLVLLGTGLGSAAGPWREAAAHRVDTQALPQHRPGSPSQSWRSARLERAVDAVASVAAAGDPPSLVDLHRVVALPAGEPPRPLAAVAAHAPPAAAAPLAAPQRWHRPAPRGPPARA